MEYLPAGEGALTRGKILCCQCGIPIEPNPANTCVACLRTQIDITEGIPKQGILYFCRGCERYLQPPSQWISCGLESRELLSLCLKKLKGLNRVRLVDAGFVWTEPHSRRIKVKLTVQKEVMGGAIMQQVVVVEFTVSHQMCDSCHRQEAKDFWRALVQVRQKTEHKKTFLYLEQLILKHKAHSNCLNIKATHDGLDFFFSKRDDARKLVEFFHCLVPCRFQTSQQLLSHDVHNNVYNYKHTFSVEIVPVCKNDVVCLPATLARSLGHIGQICICSRVTSSINLIDPNSLQVADVSSQIYWRTPFYALSSPRQLTEYVVMNVEVITSSNHVTFAGQGPLSDRHLLADVWVVRASELGTTDNQIHTRSHLGHLLKPGDTVLGFDLANANVNNPHFDMLNQDRVPDVVLVKKVYGDKAGRHRRRNWKLKHLDYDRETETSSVMRDYTDFLEDLEEDPAYRQNVNIYRDRGKMEMEVESISTEEDDVPRITLQEMMDDLTLEDTEAGLEEGAVADL